MLVLMDEAAFAGCIVPSRIVGVIETRQTERKKTVRNDRSVAVAVDAHDYQHVRKIDDTNVTPPQGTQAFLRFLQRNAWQAIQIGWHPRTESHCEVARRSKPTTANERPWTVDDVRYISMGNRSTCRSPIGAALENVVVPAGSPNFSSELNTLTIHERYNDPDDYLEGIRLEGSASGSLTVFQNPPL